MLGRQVSPPTASQINRQETSEFAARAFGQAPDASAMRRTAIGIRSKNHRGA
jgi:hypothetical protein